MKKLKTLSLCEIADVQALERLESVCDITVEKITDEDTLAAEIKDFEAVIVPYSNNMLVSEKVIDNAENLKLIASSYGGTRQNIADIYAIKKNICVIHTGASRGRPMAEFTLALALTSMLRIANYHADMTLGNEAWPRMKYPRTRILYNRKVSIIGYGRIGKAIADLFKCFTADISVVSNHLSEIDAQAANLKKISLNEAFESSEVIILAGGNTRETFHLIGKKQFELMKENALFINIARGQMVDQSAMISVAEKRPIFLALDVFENEPLESDSPLRKLSNVLITPHRANNSIEFEERWQCLADEFELFANGKTPESALTLERASVMSES